MPHIGVGRSFVLTEPSGCISATEGFTDDATFRFHKSNVSPIEQVARA